MSRNDELYDAVRKGSVEQVENYLSEAGERSTLYVIVHVMTSHDPSCIYVTGMDVNRMYERGQETLLSAAVRKGSVALVEVLLEKGADVDKATPCEW